MDRRSSLLPILIRNIVHKLTSGRSDIVVYLRSWNHGMDIISILPYNEVECCISQNIHKYLRWNDLVSDFLFKLTWPEANQKNFNDTIAITLPSKCGRRSSVWGWKWILLAVNRNGALTALHKLIQHYKNLL